ncbi:MULTISPECIES: hypothetical protein [unclassified Bartonella]|uniref:hypothetical protein n=1 Tax=unclassified Bartonella TaxID=2645622 RepID=UPI0023611D45|nr:MULTISPECIES: hypothetical protein [unclassified Bartonella]
MMDKSLFQRIFVYYAKMVVLWILAEFACSDAADVLALCWLVLHKSAHVSHHAKIVI